MNDPSAAPFIAGVAMHWYSDYYIDKRVLGETQEHWRDLYMIHTESCIGPIFVSLLGAWETAATYARDIINVRKIANKQFVELEHLEQRLD